MKLLRRKTDVTVWAPAKLNLYLEVLGKRSDGFHEIETLMTAVSLYDTLSFSATSAPELRFSCDWAAGVPLRQRKRLPKGEDNLVVRALDLLRDHTGSRRGAFVHLLKRIPLEAGLGGASADAAAALLAGNAGWDLNLSITNLREMAAELGSDVPFFLHPSPALCRGRGEKVMMQPSARLDFVIVKPASGLSTARVFARCLVPANPRRFDAGAALFNRLQQAASELSEEVCRIGESFQRCGLRRYQMTGSGTACFGICRSRKDAVRVAAAMRNAGWEDVRLASSVPGHQSR